MNNKGEVKGMDLMLDIETLGTGPDAVILEIAAVLTGYDGEVCGEFTQEVSASNCVREFGRKADAETLEWWLKRGVPIPGFASGCMSLVDALEVFVFFVEEQCDDLQRLRVWAKSPGFDCVILKHAMGQCGVEVPWRFWNEVDVRTVLSMAKWCGWVPKDRGEVEHVALADVRRQIDEVAEAMQFMNGGGSRGEGVQL